MLDRGAILGFDRFGLEILHPDRERLAVLIGLLGIGFERQIVLSHDTVWCWRGRAPMLPAGPRCRSGSRRYVFETSCRRCARRACRDDEDRRDAGRQPAPLLRGRARLPREDHDAGVGAAPDGVREADARVRHLTRAARAAELPDDLDRLAERRGAERLALREEAAARVDRAAGALISPPPSRTQRPPPPRGQRPSSSADRISRAASVSCSSTTSRSSGPSPASS